MKLQMRHATTNRTFTIDTELLGISEPPPFWIAYNNDAAGGWILSEEELNGIMTQPDADPEVWVHFPELNICLAGSVALNGVCGDPECVCFAEAEMNRLKALGWMQGLRKLAELSRAEEAE